MAVALAGDIIHAFFYIIDHTVNHSGTLFCIFISVSRVEEDSAAEEDSIADVCVAAALLPPVVSFVAFLLLPHADRHITVIMTSTANT